MCIRDRTNPLPLSRGVVLTTPPIFELANQNAPFSHVIFALDQSERSIFPTANQNADRKVSLWCAYHYCNFRAFWLAPVTRNILGYSLFCQQRKKWRAVSRKLQKKNLKKRFFYPSNLVNTKTTIPLRVGKERSICTSTLRVSVYIHYYSPPLQGIVCLLYTSPSPRDA